MKYLFIICFVACGCCPVKQSVERTPNPANDRFEVYKRTEGANPFTTLFLVKDTKTNTEYLVSPNWVVKLEKN